MYGKDGDDGKKMLVFVACFANAGALQCGTTEQIDKYCK